MHSLTAFSKSKSIIAQRISLVSVAAMLLLSGCSTELPGGNEQGDDITLATKIEREASVRQVNSLANVATWEDDDRRLLINGFNTNGLNFDGPISVTNAATGQFVGALNFDDDDNRRNSNNNNLVLRNVASIPCSVRIQVGGQVQIIPVQNAPANCVGISVTPTGFGINVQRANWKASSNKLTVVGSGASPRQLVSVFDSVTGQLLGTDQADAIGNWNIKARNLLSAPCAVTIVSGNQTAQSNVDNAPFGCANIPVFSNPIGTIPGTLNGFNQAPDGVIIGPIADMAINVGSSVNFMATGFDPDSNSTLNYRWSFEGAAPDSTQQNQTVIFTTAGVYRVTLSVTDNLGATDPTPDTRVIVVQPNVFNNQAPTGVISSPVANMEITAGQSVYISGSGFDPEGSQLRYVWNFAGGANNSTQATPGNVVFNMPGVYLISLTVVDAAGMADPTPEVRAITVRGGNTGIPGSIPGLPNNVPNNQAPNGEIISPANNMNVAIGQTISFMATAFDPDSNGLGLRYRWDFGSLAPASTQLNPGPIVFNTPGVYVVSFTVTDALGMVDPTPSIRTITVGAGGATSCTASGVSGNQAPNALISFPTNNQTISVGQSITFSGSGFDPENNMPLTYYWDFNGAATPSTLQNPGSVIFNQPGTYNVSLTATDCLGARDLTPDTRTITVLGSGNGGNQFPGSNIVNQDPESQMISPATDIAISVGDSVEFSGFGTDPENNTPLVYSWDFDDAAPDMLVQNPGRVVFTRAGSYRVRLTVIDASGNADKTPAERMITVRDAFSPNIEPTGTISSPASSMTISVGQTVNFTGFASDSNGNTLLNYEWDFGGAAASSNLQNPGSIQFNKAGIYKVTFYVKNNFGFYDSTPDVRYITVQAGTSTVNQAPEASIMSPATDLEINAGDSVNFIGNGQDQDNFGANLTYMWNFGGAFPSSSLASPGRVTFVTPGVYTVSLTVMDNFGQSDMTPATRTITVRNTQNNRAPVVTILSPTLPQTQASLGQKLNFSATATDPDNDNVRYEWNFDGAAPDSMTQNPVNIPFSSAGTYKVSVVAVDSRGLRSAPATTTVVVQGSGIVSPMAPEGTIITPANNMTITVGDTINFQGTATDVDGNLPLKYRWNFNGAAASSFAQNPGNVTFNKVGVYQVQFTVADSTGATDLTPAIRSITVVAQGGTGSVPGTGSGFGQAPVVSMISPASNTTSINVGGAVNFAATVSDPDNSVPFTYRWTFGNGLPDRFEQNPGNIFFSQAGTYVITLTVTDSQGNIGTATKTVIVGAGTSGIGNVGNSAGAPNGIINAPATGVTISRGQSIYFAGDAIDPDGDLNITYSWNFGGGATNSTQKIPGNVVFSTQGRYVVTLTVTDSTGKTDQTPASVVVTVLP